MILGEGSGVSSQMSNLIKSRTKRRRERSPHNGRIREPLGPVTPDHKTPLGDTPEAHDEIVPEDLPRSHPGRKAAERQAAAGDGTTRGDA